MPFNNPIVAGEELIRSAIRSENYTTGDDGQPGTGWAINRDGTATFSALTVRGNAEGETAAFDDISANNNLLYRGAELQDLLDDAPRGLIAFGQLPAAARTVAAGAGIRPFLELDVTVGVNRVFHIYTNHPRLTSPVGTENPRLLLFYTTDGTQPVPFAGTTILAAVANHTNVVANRIISQQVTWTAYPGNTTRMRIVLCVDAEFGNQITASFDNFQLFVEDRGKFPLTSTVIDRYAGGGGPAKTYKEIDVPFSAFRSYRNTGAYVRNDFAYQGFSPGGFNGNMSSMTWFPMGQLSDLSGVLSADIVYLEYNMFFPHWYNGSGGDAVIGYHTENAITPIGNAQNFAACIGDVLRSNYPGRNITKRVSVKGTAIETAMTNGTWRGVLLGQAPTNSFFYYGYSGDMTIRAGYFK